MRPLVALLALVASAPALASTGVCDTDPGENGPSELACVAAIKALPGGAVVADIFHDANGKTGDQLIYGQLVDPFGGCAQANSGCNGQSTDPGNLTYVCVDSDKTFAHVASYVNSLDWLWANAARLANAHGYQAAPNDKCPDWTQAVGDGSKEGYKPWEGFVFDLGGPSNKVVLFPINDHGPQPCESVEYVVYLTNNPASRDLIDNPSATGADPNKWNRAKLTTIYLEGWKKIRPGVDPGLTYTIEADSFTSVWTLPCGINFRYVGVVGGNDGKDIPECNFDSFDDELDAVAGLTEGGAGICPDADKDGYVDCACPTAGKPCDCNDGDPTVHPDAPETCADTADKNCDGKLSPCASPAICYQAACDMPCDPEITHCSPGAECTVTAAGRLCIPKDCTATSCPAGSACDPVTHTCTPDCAGVVCAAGQVCKNGVCRDPCAGKQCLSGQICQDGACGPRCDCLDGNLGCPTGTCDRNGTGTCVPAPCVGKTCPVTQVCDSTGTCVDRCAGVTCPITQKCDSSQGGCVDKCAGVTCTGIYRCNPTSGDCVDPSCINVTCPAGSKCLAGQCTAGGSDGGGGSGDGGSGAGTGKGKSGCGCGAGGAGMLLAAALAALSARARRRR